jgi:hypothetical protein
MKDSLQLLVAGWIMRGIHGLVVLTEKPAALALRELPEKHLRVIRVLSAD